MLDKEAKRKEFVASETFTRMLTALRDSPLPKSVDSDSLSYFPERTLAHAGWEFASAQDAIDFMDVVGDPDAKTIEGQATSDEDISFGNFQFRHHGLNVFMMFGQGTIVSIYNDAEKAQRDAVPDEPSASAPAPVDKALLQVAPAQEAPPERAPAKQVLVLRKDLNMRKGKMVSQGSHASVGAVTQGALYDPVKKTLTIDLSDPAFESWLMLESFKKITVSVDSEAELLALYEKVKAAGLRAVLITDAGHTEFHGVATHTAMSIGPHWPEEIDPFTSHLKLL